MNSIILHKKYIIKYYHDIEDYNIEIVNRNMIFLNKPLPKVNKIPKFYCGLCIIGTYIIINYTRSFLYFYI